MDVVGVAISPLSANSDGEGAKILLRIGCPQRKEIISNGSMVVLLSDLGNFFAICPPLSFANRTATSTALVDSILVFCCIDVSCQTMRRMGSSKKLGISKEFIEPQGGFLALALLRLVSPNSCGVALFGRALLGKVRTLGRCGKHLFATCFPATSSFLHPMSMIL